MSIFGRLVNKTLTEGPGMLTDAMRGLGRSVDDTVSKSIDDVAETAGRSIDVDGGVARATQEAISEADAIKSTQRMDSPGVINVTPGGTGVKGTTNMPVPAGGNDEAYEYYQMLERLKRNDDIKNVKKIPGGETIPGGVMYEEIKDSQNAYNGVTQVNSQASARTQGKSVQNPIAVINDSSKYGANSSFSSGGNEANIIEQTKSQNYQGGGRYGFRGFGKNFSTRFNAWSQGATSTGEFMGGVYQDFRGMKRSRQLIAGYVGANMIGRGPTGGGLIHNGSGERDIMGVPLL
jgi:hypothetical protein